MSLDFTLGWIIGWIIGGVISVELDCLMARICCAIAEYKNKREQRKAVPNEKSAQFYSARPWFGPSLAALRRVRRTGRDGYINIKNNNITKATGELK